MKDEALSGSRYKYFPEGIHVTTNLRRINEFLKRYNYFEFLTKELKFPIKRLAVTCFAGDDDAPKDTESAGIWKGLGIPEDEVNQIFKKFKNILKNCKK